MAIKGKGKTKSRPPARAPRREPVEVKPPFFMRRRVQVIGAFVAGIMVMVLGTWVTNGLRQQSADKQAQADASKQRSAGLAWQSTVETAIGKIGTISPTAPPVILPTVGTTIAELQKGKAPTDAGKTMQQAQDDAKAAMDAISKVKVADEVRDKGFTAGEVNYFLNSQTRIVEALQLYSQAASLASIAAGLTGDGRTSTADQAASVQATADQILAEGWSDYQQALYASGIAQTPVPGGSSIPGGS